MVGLESVLKSRLSVIRGGVGERPPLIGDLVSLDFGLPPAIPGEYPRFGDSRWSRFGDRLFDRAGDLRGERRGEILR